MKAKIRIPCTIKGFTGPEGKYPTWVDRLVSAQVNLPALPRVGETIYFGDAIVHFGVVARVDWFWTADKNALQPIVTLKRRMLDYLGTPERRTIEKVIESFEQKIRLEILDVIQFSLERPTVDSEFYQAPQLEF